MLRLAPIVVLSFCTVIALPFSIFAADPAQLEVVAAKVPDDVAEPIRTALSQTMLRLAIDGKPVFEFWFRRELPLAEKPDGGTLGVGTLKEGTVLGVVRVTGEPYDFRNEEIPAGVYIVRLGLQPEDGNHLGVAPTRTFAVLTPAKQDARLEPIAHKDLMKAAATINAAKHPSNLNLQPVEKADGDFPRLEERSGGEHKVVLVRLPGRIGDAGEPTTLTFALVYEGTGQI
jgi:hypothetical protein